MRAWSVLLLAPLVIGCPAGDPPIWPTDSGFGDRVDPLPDANGCPAGTIQCYGNEARTCDGRGGYSSTVSCGTAGMCSAGRGCVAVDLCAQAAARRSYLGCEYWPVSLLNSGLGGMQQDPDNPSSRTVGTDGFPFAIAVANPQTVPAEVRVEGGALPTTMTQTVAPGSLQVIQLPWVRSVSQVVATNADPATVTDGRSVFAVGGAYHVTTSVPVTIYQFNPLGFRDNRSQCARANPTVDYQCYTFSNDSSLLLPSTVLTRTYTVMSMPSFGILSGSEVSTNGGFMAIVATQPNTHVTVHLTGAVRAGVGVTGAPPGGTIEQTMNPGDVLELVSGEYTTSTCNRDPTPIQSSVYGNRYACRPNAQLDLTGSIVTADNPIAVYGGHDCTFVPFNRFACDHLEEQLFPNETWGHDYLVSRTQPQLSALRHGDEPNFHRILSNAASNSISFIPSSVHAPITLERGQFVDFESGMDFEVSGSGPFEVAQFFVGQNYFGNNDPAQQGANLTDDPAMGLEVPIQQWRTSYTFLAPDTYSRSYVNVVAHRGSIITLDGAPLTVTPIVVGGADGQYEVYRVDISSRTGSHSISTSGQPFGIKVYGFGSYTSHMYPGGLDLTQIAPPG